MNGNGKAVISAVAGAVVGALVTAGLAGVAYGGRLARLEATVQTIDARQDRLEDKIDALLAQERRQPLTESGTRR